MKFIIKNLFMGRVCRKQASDYLNTAKFYKNLAEAELALGNADSDNYRTYCKEYAYNRNMAANCFGFRTAEEMDIYNKFHENN